MKKFISSLALGLVAIATVSAAQVLPKAMPVETTSTGREVKKAVAESDEFVFNPSEWKYEGEALFQDGWAWPLINYKPEPYQVPLYSNVSDPSLYLLYDPYGPNTPFAEHDFNADGNPGYLVFSIEDPDCVVFMPDVLSYTTNYQYPDVPFYNYNWEGYLYYKEDWTTDRIRTELQDGSYRVSKYDSDTKTVNIVNVRFSYEVMDSGPFSWNGFGDLDGFITFPGGSQPAPVEYYITGDNVNGKSWELAQPDAKFTEIETGIYEWRGDFLYTNFKINNGSWDNYEYNFGSYGEGLGMFETHSILRNGQNFQFEGFAYLVDPIIYLDTNSLSITIVDGLPDGEEFVGNAIYYIWHDGSWEQMVSLDDGFYYLDDAGTTMTDGIAVARILNGVDTYYGPNSSSPYISMTEPYTFEQCDFNNLEMIEFGNFDLLSRPVIVLDPNNQTVTIEQGNTYVLKANTQLPAWLYIDFADDTRYVMQNMGKGIYEWTGKPTMPFKISGVTNDLYNIGGSGQLLIPGEAYNYVAGPSVEYIEVYNAESLTDDTVVTVDLNSWQINVGNGTGTRKPAIAGSEQTTLKKVEKKAADPRLKPINGSIKK